MQDAEKMREAYGVSTIFIATDNQHIIDWQLQHYPQWRFMHLEIDRFLPDDQWGDAYLHSLSAEGKVGLQGEGIVFDMLLLADCDYFIGHADSMVTKATVHLMSAKKNYNPPFILKMPMPWEMLGCDNCTWWYQNVQRYNANQLDEAEEICDTRARCPPGWLQTAQLSAGFGAPVPPMKNTPLKANARVDFQGHFWDQEPNFAQVRVLREGIPALIQLASTHLLGEALPHSMVLHLVGASDDDEARADYMLLFQMLQEAGVEDLTVWLVGPHVHPNGEREPCGTCLGKADAPGLRVKCVNGLYHDWVEQGTGVSEERPHVAFMMNCGLAGEFEDFLPTLKYLRDAGILTVVSNYWYESTSVSRDGSHRTILKQPRPAYFHPEGNQNEMWGNEMSLEAIGVRFEARYVRNPYAMRYGLLHLPEGTSPSGTTFHATKNGYFHAFKGEQGEPVSDEQAKKKVLGGSLQVLAESRPKELSEETKGQMLQLAQECYAGASSCDVKAVRRLKKRGHKSIVQFWGGPAWKAAAIGRLGKYEDLQEAQEGLFSQSCGNLSQSATDKVLGQYHAMSKQLTLH